jgi:pimeloyl-ACP methyl ester carboxylesterase
MAYADLKAGRFHYKDTGGELPAVVFSHGFLMDHEMFEMQVAELAAQYRCIAWDQRGHGVTEVRGKHSFWDSAADLKELLDSIEVDRFFHVGMSQGGFIGLRVALNMPDRVRGLVFIDSQAGQEDPNAMPMYEAMVQAWVAGQERESLVETVAQIICGPNTDHNFWTARWLQLDPDVVPVIFETLTSREDLHNRLSEITCPALVIHGTEDTAIPFERARALAKGLRAGDVVQIQGAGHSANLADPLTVNHALKDFLNAHSGS